MQKITPHLWYDKEAKDAAVFYASVFPDSHIKNTTVLHNTPSGSVDIITMDICSQEFTLISAGPYFKFTPAISFIIACKTKEEVDGLWNKLVEGGQVMMELQAYPFSERFGWLADKYGLSWQLIAMGDNPIKQKITPSLLFVGAVTGKAEEAMQFYTSVFHDAVIGFVMRYGKGEEPEKVGTIKHAGFTLAGQQFAAADSAHDHKFAFNEAVSFIMHCETQEEIDYYWEKLSAVPESEQCGWLKDKFGVSWQIVPIVMEEMMKNGDEKKITKITEAFLKMKKFDIAELERVYRS